MKKDQFGALFRKYRLKSEFETLHEFGDVLADHNFIYENSIFSHWQKGTRIPKDRRLLIILIKIFIEREGLCSIEEANVFMASTGQGYLTEEEIKSLPFKQQDRFISTYLTNQNSSKLDPTFLKPLANYYISFLSELNDTFQSFWKLTPELNTIVQTIDGCIVHNFIDEACNLWNTFGKFYWHLAPWETFSAFSKKIYDLAKKNNKTEIQLSICLQEITRFYYYDGNVTLALEKAKEALSLATETKNKFYIASAHQRYGKLCLINNDYKNGNYHLSIAGKLFKQLKMHEYESHNYRYLSEASLLQNDIKTANNLLIKSYEKLKKLPGTSQEKIYSAVIYSQMGTLSFLKKDFNKAKELFEKGLTYDGKIPLARGTYTWLNKLGLAHTYKAIGNLEKGTEMLEEAKQQMKLLGIEKSYNVINVYAKKLSLFLD